MSISNKQELKIKVYVSKTQFYNYCVLPVSPHASPYLIVYFTMMLIKRLCGPISIFLFDITKPYTFIHNNDLNFEN